MIRFVFAKLLFIHIKYLAVCIVVAMMTAVGLFIVRVRRNILA